MLYFFFCIGRECLDFFGVKNRGNQLIQESRKISKTDIDIKHGKYIENIKNNLNFLKIL